MGLAVGVFAVVVIVVIVVIVVVVVIAVDVVVVPVSSSRSLSSAEHLSPPSSRLILCLVLTLRNTNIILNIQTHKS